MDEILTIKQTYFGVSNPIDNVLELTKALNRWYLTYPEYNFLHPCVIDGKASLVCQRDLSHLNHCAFAALGLIAEQFHLFLKQDNRTPGVSFEFVNRRKQIVLVLTFCVLMLATSKKVSAAKLQSSPGNRSVTASFLMQTKTDKVEDTVIHLRHAIVPAAEQQTSLPTAEQIIAAYAQQKVLMKVDPQAEVKIKEFLLGAYQAESDDPANIKGDMAEIAKYYAQYPEVVQLLEELNPKKVVLKYNANHWQAQAWGNQYAVDSVIITFDTREGAQLLNSPDCKANPACDISPADALLHELLHAKLMLIDSQHFIDQGNMQTNLYPVAHEQEVLMNEKRLFGEMNHEDGMSRPLRTQHAGELFHVNCAACSPNQIMASR